MHGCSLRVVGALLRVHLALQVDEHGLARRDVALELVAGAFQRHRLAGDHHVPSLPRPMDSGRMPYGSRKASTPWPAMSATTAYEPRTRLCTLATAVNTSCGVQLHAARGASPARARTR
jgi:hypothetical protein